MHFRLLRIDLNSHTVKKEEVSNFVVDAYLGGRGLGVRLFFDEINDSYFKNADYKSAPIFFMTGLMTGSKAPLSGRFHSVFHSPLTNTICDSSCGGKAGVFLKTLGIDGIVVTGYASKPLYLLVDAEDVTFKDAGLIAGKTISERERLIRDLHGDKLSTILIGPAGENGCLFASAVSDRRFFGRGGLGTVMGFKNLLGVVVKKGSKKLGVPLDVAKFDYVVEETKKWIHGNPITSQGLPEFGTSVLMNLINELNILPYKNFNESHFESAELISGEVLKSKVIRHKACYGCMIACGRVTNKGEGPEFETLWALGANLGVSDIDFLIELNEICYEYGIDTISLGGTIACYIEANNLSFGDKSLIMNLVDKTLKNKAEGKLINMGSKRLASELNKETLSMSVKGMELPAYHPKGLYGMALAYGTSNRGACHLRSYMIAPEVLGIPKLISPKIKSGKAGLVIYFQNSHAASDSAIFCRFLGLAVNDDYLARMVSAFTGRDLSTTDYQRIGERIYVLERIFNLKAGFTRKDDFLPDRLMFEGYDRMLTEYYRARGYDDLGVPTKEKLIELGLEEFYQGKC